MLLLHLTPQLPPAICGLGDYATVVGARMEGLRPGVRCAYLACGHRVAPQNAERLWQNIERLSAEQAAKGPADGALAIILHYSGYGYAPNGAPAWLAEALERRPAWLGGARVVTFFHELYASGKPWERAYWVSGRQQSAAERIARASDALVTNCEQSARWLEGVTGRAAGSVPHLAICSNVGEPAELVPWDERARQAVTFGGARYKRFALCKQAEEVACLLRQLEIEELIDMGESVPIATGVFERAGVRVETRGRLPAADVSAVLSQSRVGFLEYPPNFVAKSGVFAGFAAHGVKVVLRQRMPLALNGLEHAAHFVALGDDRAAEDVARWLTSSSVVNWYQSHNIERHAELYLGVAAQLRGTCRKYSSQS